MADLQNKYTVRFANHDFGSMHSRLLILLFFEKFHICNVSLIVLFILKYDLRLRHFTYATFLSLSSLNNNGDLLNIISLI